MPKISVIISTYDQPKWLEKCLWSYNRQTFDHYEVIVADDGSGSDTRELIEAITPELSYPIKHLWHESSGSKKCSILNQATLAASHPYLLFTDGSCLAHPNMLALHAKHAKKELFLSGSHFNVDLEVSSAITKSDILSRQIFSLPYLRMRGQRYCWQMLKLCFQSPLSSILDTLTTAKSTWSGYSNSIWKEDLLAINGHNEDVLHSGQYCELDARLLNFGIKSKQMRHRSCMLQLSHPVSKDKDLHHQTSSRKVQWAPNGVEKVAPKAQFKTYLINLDRSPERLEYSAQEFKKHGIEYERVQAIDGQDLDINDYPQATANSAYYHTPLSANEVACYLSHIKCLELFLASDAEHALITEDDFRFLRDPTCCLNILAKVQNWDIVKLYSFKKRKLQKHRQSFTVESMEDYCSLAFCASTAICNTSQFFTRAGAEKFLAHKRFFRRPVDVDLKHYWERDLKILSIDPPVVAEHVMTQPISTIGHTKPKATLRTRAKKLRYTVRFQAAKLFNYCKNC